MKTKVIVNPMARKGKSGQRWPETQAKLKRHLDQFDVTITRAPGDAREIARLALADGYEQFVAVGGDGTLNEVLNGLCRDGALINPNTVICPLPQGTANEVCRNLGMAANSDEPFRAIGEGRIQEIDLLHYHCTGLDGGDIDGHAALVVSFGSSAEISYRTNHSKFVKKLSAELSYYIVALIVTLSYRPKPTTLRIDDLDLPKELVSTALACNMRFLAGGMSLAPDAKPDDGQFNLIVFKDIGRLELITKPKSWLFEGRHIDHPKISVYKGTRLEVTGEPDVLVDADGETAGRLPLKVQLHPGGLRVRNL